jgi:hypothetical protein
MKKIGIITLHDSFNYGAALQACALCSVIQNFGYETEIINYTPLSVKQFSNPFGTIDLSRPIKSSLLAFYFGVLLRKQRQKMFERYSKFRRDYLNITLEQYHSDEEMKHLNTSQYSAFICGSDIIWNPRHLDDQGFQLNFVPDGIPKISYAPSFATDAIPNRYHSILRKNLLKFTSISVRENQGAKIVQEISGLEPEVVLDPTLLLTPKEWESYELDTKTKKPYVLLYSLYTNSNMRHFCQWICKKTGQRLVCISPIPKNFMSVPTENYFDFGPSEFLRAYRDASFIIAGSYHSMIFALIYQKPFYFIPDIRPSFVQRNARIYEVIQRFGIESCIVPNTGDSKEYSLEVDYSSINTKIQHWRNKSLTFLKKSLENIKLF